MIQKFYNIYSVLENRKVSFLFYPLNAKLLLLLPQCFAIHSVIVDFLVSQTKGQLKQWYGYSEGQLKPYHGYCDGQLKLWYGYSEGQLKQWYGYSEGQLKQWYGYSEGQLKQ